jgi:hypothetical protein
MTAGYLHGPINCAECFPSNESPLKIDEWRLTNNPGYYGSTSPKILVLGFSKGANQNKAEKIGGFDEIAFAGARHRLQEVLECLGVMPSDRSIDALMTGNEREFGVTSIVRCSFCKMKNGVCKTSGDVIPSSFTNAKTLSVIETCTSKYLSVLQESTNLVILLGTSETYIKKTKIIFSSMYPDYEQVNHVAFKAGGALWVYGTHPSPGNGYFRAWADKGPEDSSGQKRILAVEAINKHYA